MLSSATLGLTGMELNLFIAAQVLWPSRSLKHSNVSAISKQTLNSIKGFSLSLSDALSTQQIRCGWTIGREGAKLGQLTPLNSEIFHTIQCVLLSTKTGGQCSRVAIAQGLAVHWLAVTSFASLSFTLFYSLTCFYPNFCIFSLLRVSPMQLWQSK